MLRVFQSVRGLADDSVTRLDKNEDLSFEMRDLTKLHLVRNFMRSKGDFERRQHRSSRLRSRYMKPETIILICVRMYVSE